jgi:hypothetical protein
MAATSAAPESTSGAAEKLQQQQQQLLLQLKQQQFQQQQQLRQQLFQRRKKPKEQSLRLQHQLYESVPEWRQETEGPVPEPQSLPGREIVVLWEHRRTSDYWMLSFQRWISVWILRSGRYPPHLVNRMWLRSRRLCLSRRWSKCRISAVNRTQSAAVIRTQSAAVNRTQSAAVNFTAALWVRYGSTLGSNPDIPQKS